MNARVLLFDFLFTPPFTPPFSFDTPSFDGLPGYAENLAYPLRRA
jgi:hypothetical protein